MTEERGGCWILPSVILGLIFWVLLAWFLWPKGAVDAECVTYPPNPPHEPTGVKGCEVYGEGVASQWQGPGVARNDCVYPWADCQLIRITSLDTGRSIEVRPNMYCDCYTGTADQRIVDLDPDSLARLGLDPSRGLHRVIVEPVVQPVLLPDTRMER